MSITAKDIARELNLSQPTVSRILNGDSGHRASEATRQRVWEVARSLGYQPNAIARSLRRGRTDMIGIHTGRNYDVRNDFLGAVVGSLQRACAPRGLDLMLHTAAPEHSAEGIFGKLRDGRLDGLILHTSVSDPLVEMLRDSSLPVVAVADPLPGLPAVTSNDDGGMRLLIEALWSKGYREFVFLAPQMHLTSVERRRAAFEDELTRRAIKPQARQIISIEVEMAAPVLPQLLAQSAKGKSLAVCCWNDRTAYNLLRACAAQGVGVPEQLAVAGFDGFRDERLPARYLMTMRCPWEEVATTALELLVEMIAQRHEGKKRPVEAGHVQEISLPVVLWDGDTA